MNNKEEGGCQIASPEQQKQIFTDKVRGGNTTATQVRKDISFIDLENGLEFDGSEDGGFPLR